MLDRPGVWGYICMFSLHMFTHHRLPRRVGRRLEEERPRLSPSHSRYVCVCLSLSQFVHVLLLLSLVLLSLSPSPSLYHLIFFCSTLHTLIVSLSPSGSPFHLSQPPSDMSFSFPSPLLSKYDLEFRIAQWR